MTDGLDKMCTYEFRLPPFILFNISHSCGQQQILASVLVRYLVRELRKMLWTSFTTQGAYYSTLGKTMQCCTSSP